ncbi:MAG: polyprenyl synthetase family protein [Anaerolineae bacterium]
MSLEKEFGLYLAAIEDEMRQVVRTADPTLAPFYGMMQYHLGWVDEALQPTVSEPGKRIRPLICLLTCQALSGDFERALPAAAALELTHNFSLIYDDVEDADRE